MHLNSKLIFEQYAKKYFKDGKRVLEIGPSGFPSVYQNLIGNQNLIWHTIDFDDSIHIGESAQSRLTYKLTDPYQFPIDSESYDIILSGQVIEHVGLIWRWIKELKRVLKPGGIIITINPVSWPYHEAPIDCWRIFPDGIKSLAFENDLKVVECLFDSLEKDEIFKRDKHAVFIPGKSYAHEYPGRKLAYIIFWNKFIRRIPIFKNYLQVPIEISYDTLSVLGI